MSRIGVLTSDEARKALSAVVGQVGATRMASALARAWWRNRRSGHGLGREYFLALWDSLEHREAVVDGDFRITFGAFKDRVLRLTDAMHLAGLREGDACAVLLYNSRHWFEINQACNLSGILMPMLNWHLKPAELAACINRSGARMVMTDIGSSGNRELMWSSGR